MAMSFEKDIKPLFRQFDVDCMEAWFDLRVHADVSEHADGILERVADGSMPCDEPWDEAKVKLFETWIAEGKQP
jgi:hypothetical protein